MGEMIPQRRIDDVIQTVGNDEVETRGVRVIYGFDGIDPYSVEAIARAHHRRRADKLSADSDGHDVKFSLSGKRFPPGLKPGVRQEQPLQTRTIHKPVPFLGDLVEAAEVVNDFNLEMARCGALFCCLYGLVRRAHRAEPSCTSGS